MQGYSEKEFFDKYSVRTDLALEAHRCSRTRRAPELPGVKVETVEKGQAVINRVTVENEMGARMIGKAPGYYSTIESRELRTHNREVHEELARYLAEELEWFIQQKSWAMKTQSWWWALATECHSRCTWAPCGSKPDGYTTPSEMSPPELRHGLRPIAAISPVF